MGKIYRPYTGAERRQRAWLLLRGTRQALAGAVDQAVEGRIDRIDAAAEDRGQREAMALVRQHERAKDDLATARAAERAARGEARKTAQVTRKAAEQRVRDAEAAMRHLP